MPQFRLTQKMATKLKIDNLSKPNVIDEPFYDDWVMDMLRIRRMEVVVLMHVKTRMSLAITLHEIGGAKNLFDFLPVSLEWHINGLGIEGYEDFGCDIRNYFESKDLTKFNFCKTEDRSVLAHLNQFKDILEYQVEKLGVLDQCVCDETIEYWHTNLITNPYNQKEYTRPIELWSEFLNNFKPIEIS